jgi:hypothetical protein
MGMGVALVLDQGQLADPPDRASSRGGAMDANKPPTGSTRCEKSEAGTTSTEVLIIGFGFSIIPLITELERDGIDYVAVSDGDSIWDKLEKHDRLDSDMVSSMHTSLQSFELVNRDAKDRYRR